MSCLAIPQLEYGSFSERVHEEALRNRSPVNGSFALTYRCNLKCGHCYGVVDPQKKELTTQEVFLCLDRMAEAGCLWLLLTGGEPLVREDFPEIYRYAKTKGFILALFTNGTLLTPEIADLLKDYPPFYIEISLYAATELTYRKVTGVSGAYEKCLGGIRLLLERKLPLSLKTLVTVLNREELSAVRHFAQDVLGLDFRFDPMIRPRLDGSRGPLSLRMEPEDIFRLDAEDAERCREWIRLGQQFGAAVRPDRLFSCPAGEIMFEVDPYGEVFACDMVRDFRFNILQMPLRSGWEAHITKIHSLKYNKSDLACRSCRDYLFCDICPGWSRLEANDYEAVVDHLCSVAHLRAEKFASRKTGGEDGKKVRLSEAGDPQG